MSISQPPRVLNTDVLAVKLPRDVANEVRRIAHGERRSIAEIMRRIVATAVQPVKQDQQS